MAAIKCKNCRGKTGGNKFYIDIGAFETSRGKNPENTACDTECDFDVGLRLGDESDENAQYCSDGIHRGEECNSFYQCSHGNRHPTQYCPVNTLFNNKLLICDWPENVICESMLSGHVHKTVHHPNMHQKAIKRGVQFAINAYLMVLKSPRIWLNQGSLFFLFLTTRWNILNLFLLV